jgi:hypothetical protein
MQKTQRLIGLSFLATALSVVGITQVSAAFFQDTSGHWANQYAESLKSECNVEGFKNSQGDLLYQFRPNASITRAELVKMISQCNPSNTDPLYDGDYDINFTDVRSSDWFYQSILKARFEGWVDGYSDQTFRPNQNINRAEALKIILSSEFSVGDFSSDNTPYPDVPSSAWFAKYVNLAYRYNFVSGYSDGNFRPGNSITRAEAAKIIMLVKHWDGTIAHDDSNDDNSNDTDDTSDDTDDTTDDNDDIVASGDAPQIAGCQIFPADNPWNTDISNYALHPNSANFIASIGADDHLHPDFGSPAEYGIPFVIADANTPNVQVNAEYADESDFGLAPIPANPPIEGTSSSDGDRHVIVLDKSDCTLYETWSSYFEGGVWNVGSAAKFDLSSNALRPDGWTSADAAGLPILPGLVRYDEVQAGEINHALRFTVSQTQRGYIHPATHFASSNTDANVPPMGLRLRLKADFDISGYSAESQVVLRALKKYGMIVADNGSDWFISGESNPNWNDEAINQLKQVPGSAFEVVNTGAIIK